MLCLYHRTCPTPPTIQPPKSSFTTFQKLLDTAAGSTQNSKTRGNPSRVATTLDATGSSWTSSRFDAATTTSTRTLNSLSFTVAVRTKTQGISSITAASMAASSITTTKTKSEKSLPSIPTTPNSPARSKRSATEKYQPWKKF